MGIEKTVRHTGKAEEYLQAMDVAFNDNDFYHAVELSHLARAHMMRVNQFLAIANSPSILGVKDDM